MTEPRSDASSASPRAQSGRSRGGRLLVLVVALVVMGVGGRLAYVQAFTLGEVDFDVLGRIAHHATERQPGGRLAHLRVGRMTIDQADVLWLASVEVAGEHRHWFYDLDGEPLVDSPRDFLAPEASWFSPLEKKAGPLRVVGVQLQPDRASVPAMAPNSDRDTDDIALDANGVIGAPRPRANGADPALLRTKVFKLADVAWAVVPRVVADPSKKHDGEVTYVSIERSGDAFVLKASVRTKRGLTHVVEYDHQAAAR